MKRFIALFCATILIFSVSISAAASDVLGDANGDGVVNLLDARFVLRYALGLPADIIVENCNVNNDDKINVNDAKQILRFALKIIDDFNPQVDKTKWKVAMFGDSLVEGLALYVDSERIDYYGKLNTNTSNIYTKKPSGHNETMLNCVTGKGYNIIIMLVGINEVGNNTAAYIDAYRKVAEKVMNDNPDAQFVIHAMLPISASASNQNRYGVTNQNINIKNEALKNLADEIGCGFVDAGVIFRNEYGVLPEGISSDGIHMNKKYCEKWDKWLIETLL
jgi:lysophospholipase L1-like esterase